MFIRSSERIYNPSCYTGCIYDYNHSFFRKDFQSNALYWLYLWLCSIVLRREFLIQVAMLVFTIMLTLSSERIFNRMRYTGCRYICLCSLVLRRGFSIQCAILVVYTIRLTRSSERIFNPRCYIGIYDYAHSFFGEDFQWNALYRLYRVSQNSCPSRFHQ